MKKVFGFAPTLALSAALTVIHAVPRAFADSYRVELPRDVAESQESVGSAQKTDRMIEVGMSSWAPSSFTLPGRISASAALQPTWLPPTYVNTKLFSLGLSGLTAKAGFNWAMLERRGEVNLSGVQVAQVQSVHLFSVRAGLEFAPAEFSSRIFSPYLTASFLPTLAVTERSSFDAGASYGGLPVEAGVGTLVRGGGLLKGASSFDLILGLIGTAGSIAGSGVSGLGLNGGIRVIL